MILFSPVLLYVFGCVFLNLGAPFLCSRSVCVQVAAVVPESGTVEVEAVQMDKVLSAFFSFLCPFPRFLR